MKPSFTEGAERRNLLLPMKLLFSAPCQGKNPHSCLYDSRASHQNHFRPQSDPPRAIALRKKKQMKRQYDFSKARRGPVVPPTPGKTRITIRLDNDVIEHFQATVDRAGGGNYQTLINDALREHIRGARLEKIVRKAVREEVRAVSEALSRTA
jgi:uncharacterized protein (DUF4415 family)